MKKTNEYWSKRQTQWINNQNKADEQLMKKLEKQYRKTASELESEIARYFQAYGEEGVIEFRTLMKDLPERDKKLLFEDFEAFAEEYPEYEHLLPVRESIYKLNRLEGLHYSTQLELLELGAIEQKEIENHLRKTYGKHFEYVAKELGIGKQFISLNSKVITDTIYSKWINESNFSMNIWGNKDKLLNHLTTAYRDSLVRGDDYKQMAQNLADRFGVAINDAKRLVWTESSFVLNQAHAQPYKDLGVKEYQINAVLDHKTSKICKGMNGQKFRFDETMVGVNFPPFHPYCRTTYIAVGLNDLLEEDASDQEQEEIKFSSAEEARKTLVEKGGFREVEESFLRINEEQQISNIEQLLKLEEKFGAVHESTSATIAGVSLGRVNAFVDSSVHNPLRQTLSFSPSAFSDRREVIDNKRKLIEKNWQMPAKMTDEILEVYTVTHEYGHMMQNMLVAELMKEKGWDPKNPMNMVETKRKTYKAKMKFYTKTKADATLQHMNEIVEIAKEKDPKFEMSEHISDYGKTKRTEFFAEVFANSQLGAPNALGDAMNVWLKRKGLVK